MTIQIETGKTYTCRDGSEFKATEKTGRKGTYAIVGEDENGKVTWRSEKGRFDRYPHKLDVVSEK